MAKKLDKFKKWKNGKNQAKRLKLTKNINILFAERHRIKNRVHNMMKNLKINAQKSGKYKIVKDKNGQITFNFFR